MYTVKLKQWIEENYMRISYSDLRKLELISDLLAEIGFLVNYVKECIAEEGAFNYQSVLVRKKDNNLYLFYRDSEDENSPTLTIEQDKFMGLLDKWNEVYQKLPPFIEVSMDDKENINIRALEK